MELLQGNTYYLPIKITRPNGDIVSDNIVNKIVVTLGELEKSSERDEIIYDSSNQTWRVILTEEDSFKLKGNVKWQARLLFSDGTVDGTIPDVCYVYKSINFTLLTGGDDNA